MNDELFQIRNAHQAMLQMLATFMSKQHAVNKIFIEYLAEVSGRPMSEIQKTLNEIDQKEYANIRDMIYQDYGIIDKDDLLKEPLPGTD